MASRVASPLLPGDNQFRERLPTENLDSPRHDRQRARGLKRKVSLRDGFIRKLKKEGTRVSWNHNGKIKRQKPLKKISRALRERLKIYQALATRFLTSNPTCEICRRRREAEEDIQQNASSEVHHYAGRTKDLLCYVPYFIASCHPCRMWPHENTVKARELRLLAPPAQWNVFPLTGENRR